MQECCIHNALYSMCHKKHTCGVILTVITIVVSAEHVIMVLTFVVDRSYDWLNDKSTDWACQDLSHLLGRATSLNIMC